MTNFRRLPPRGRSLSGRCCIMASAILNRDTILSCAKAILFPQPKEKMLTVSMLG